jgi:tryptophan-rich sensory protein
MSLRRDALILSVAFVISFATAGIGGALTDLGPWYQALKQPDWKPPDAAFGVIWSTIFTLGAFSGWLAWRQAPMLRERLVVLAVFLINLCLNILWSWLFFVQHRPDWSLVELYFLWASIVARMVVSWRLAQTFSTWGSSAHLAVRLSLAELEQRSAVVAAHQFLAQALPPGLPLLRPMNS